MCFASKAVRCQEYLSDVRSQYRLQLAILKIPGIDLILAREKSERRSSRALDK